MLRGLSSRMLPCGCLVGVYETYTGAVVGTIDARGPACLLDDHAKGALVPVPPHPDVPLAAPPPAGR